PKYDEILPTTSDRSGDSWHTQMAAQASQAVCGYSGHQLPSTRRSAGAAKSTTATILAVHQLMSRAQHVLLRSPPPSQLCIPATPLSSHLSSRGLSISETFANLKEQGKVAFIPYITAGDPDLSTTAEALRILDACGSKIIELGIPCSNPLADGPVIQAAAARALAKGTNIDKIFSMLKEVISQISCPITLLAYYDSILKYGVPRFLVAMNSVGVRGLIIPDLPPEEVRGFTKEAKKNKVELVLIVTPSTQTEQMRAIAEASEGFLYLASHSGATGARPSINPDVEFVLQKIRKLTNKPVSVGFGISKPEHVRQLSTWGADGVIVGSAIVKLLGEAKSPGEGLRQMEAFSRSLINGCPLLEQPLFI
ncbi:hypothetical protein Taro_001558, partial [Colocasia esculenta]|nr:hypothetical protein [Colocasia esculenta]